MKADPFLEEIWRVKDKLSREMSANPDAYRAKLNAIAKNEAETGRKIIRSPEELRRFAAEQERKDSNKAASILREVMSNSAGIVLS